MIWWSLCYKIYELLEWHNQVWLPSRRIYSLAVGQTLYSWKAITNRPVPSLSINTSLHGRKKYQFMYLCENLYHHAPSVYVRRYQRSNRPVVLKSEAKSTKNKYQTRLLRIHFSFKVFYILFLLQFSDVVDITIYCTNFMLLFTSTNKDSLRH